MLHLSTETHNNKKVWKVFRQISTETCLEMDYFVVNPQDRQALGASPPDPLASGGLGLHPQTPSRLNE